VWVGGESVHGPSRLEGSGKGVDGPSECGTTAGGGHSGALHQQTPVGGFV